MLSIPDLYHMSGNIRIFWVLVRVRKRFLFSWAYSSVTEAFFFRLVTRVGQTFQMRSCPVPRLDVICRHGRRRGRGRGRRLKLRSACFRSACLRSACLRSACALLACSLLALCVRLLVPVRGCLRLMRPRITYLRTRACMSVAVVIRSLRVAPVSTHAQRRATVYYSSRTPGIIY